MKELLKKYESIISYGFFGICTTLVNIVIYYLFAHILKCSTAISTIFAWIVAVAFALITNKIWVFKSKSWDKNTLIKETISFFSCRLLTGLLDLLIMVLFVDILKFNDIIIKVLSNILVIVLNYVASKLIIFNNKIKFDYKKIFLELFVLLIILFMTFIVVMQSPLNVFNTPGVSGMDSSVFRSIEMFMSNGLMPYKDLFDHKGPLIYIINYIGQLISYNHGVWYIEIITIFVAILFIYKTARLFCNRIFSIITTVISSSALLLYFEGGNLTEEYALPFIAISLYIFIDYLKNNKISIFRLIICGFSFGAVCMLRINMVSVWFVFSIAILIKSILEKQYKQLFKFIFWFLTGLFIIALPILVWLGVNDAFHDFIYDYFTFNTIYSNDARLYSKVGTFIFFFNNSTVLIAFLVCLYLCFKKKDTLSITYLVCFLITLMCISMSGRNYYHYGMVLVPILIYPFSIIMKMVNVSSNKNGLVLFIPLLLLCYIALPIWIKGSLDSLNVYGYYTINNNSIRQSAIYKISKDIKNNSTPDDKITVYGGRNIIYILSERSTASKYSFQEPLVEVNKQILEDYFNDLSNNLPKLIVVDLNDKYINGFINKNEYYLIAEYSKLKLYKRG